MASSHRRDGGFSRRVNIAAAAVSLAAVATLGVLAAQPTQQAPAPDTGRLPVASASAGTAAAGASSASSPASGSAVATQATGVARGGSAVAGAPSAAGSPVASASGVVGRVLGRPPATETIATRIQLPRLGIDLPIVEGDGIDAPLDKAAHYPGTAWPGAGSNIYIYGHAQEGMFLALWDARVGDEIVLTLADGTSVVYRIVRVMPRVPWDAVQFLDPTPHEQLTLQTSTSNTATAPRFVVIARPAQ